MLLLKGKMVVSTSKGAIIMDKKKRDKMKNRLNSTQEVLYSKEFNHADRAGGYDKKRNS